MKRIVLLVCIGFLAIGAKAPPSDPAHFVSTVTKSRNQFVFNAITPLISVEFTRLTAFSGDGGLWAFNCPNLTTVLFPKAASVSFLNLGGNVQLSDVQLPLLKTAGVLAITGSDALVEVDLSLLSSASTLSIRNNHNLTTVYFPLLSPPSGAVVDFYDNALNQSSVDSIIQKCVDSAEFVTGTLSIGGGANSPPSAIGLANLQLLVARGVMVSFNP